MGLNNTVDGKVANFWLILGFDSDNMMLSSKSESDVTSLAPSSPSRSPKRPVYYVQSPSRDSHDGDKASSLQATPISHSPMDSPSNHSFGRHSRNSSASRFSGIFRSSSGRKVHRKRPNDKGWPECNVILEDGCYDELEEKRFMRQFQALIALLSFVILFTVFCLIIWGASRPYKAEISIKVSSSSSSSSESIGSYITFSWISLFLLFFFFQLQSLTLSNYYVGEGSDFSGVVTKMVTLNGSLRINVYNPASLFGIHVTSTLINLVYSEIPIATGQVKT